MKTTITLHSNNSKAIWEAADIVERIGWEKASTYCYFRTLPGQEPLVVMSIGEKISDRHATNYRLHRTVTVEGPILY